VTICVNVVPSRVLALVGVTSVLLETSFGVSKLNFMGVIGLTNSIFASVGSGIRRLFGVGVGSVVSIASGILLQASAWAHMGVASMCGCELTLRVLSVIICLRVNVTSEVSVASGILLQASAWAHMGVAGMCGSVLTLRVFGFVLCLSLCLRLGVGVTVSVDVVPGRVLTLVGVASMLLETSTRIGKLDLMGVIGLTDGILASVGRRIRCLFGVDVGLVVT